jgi:uncharacterized protein (DUF1800 family)
MTFLEHPDEAWERLPDSEWNEAAARHLLRRAGWTARPDDVTRAKSEGLERTLTRLFPAAPIACPKPSQILKFEADLPALRDKARDATGFEKLSAQRDLREHSQAALQDFRVKWLQTASVPDSAAFVKWVLFLSDVYVVSAEKVRHAGFIWRHFDTLGRHAFDRAPVLTKAISRSPAMALYLDLEQSNKAAPNENFARELFELFVLGEGHYSEKDIKEAARAFTGYRINPMTGEFRLNVRRHDAGSKTLFGESGHFKGDDVIDLAYQQSSAAEFLPRELARFYLSDAALPSECITALAARWRKGDYDLRLLAHDFFGSRLFFAPEYRSNFIKSPVQFYLGLLQDIELSVPPLARYSSNRLRKMGQQLFQPPNVRGWIGGRAWINSSTLAVRRQLVQQLFSPIKEQALNADEVAALNEARAAGVNNFTVSATWLETLAAIRGDTLASQIATAFLAADATPDLLRTVAEFVGNDTDRARRIQRLRAATIALLQTPDYQLC